MKRALEARMRQLPIWTLCAPLEHDSLAQGHAAMDAAIAHTADAPGLISPEDQRLPHPRHADGLILDLLGLENDVPLVRNHGSTSNAQEKQQDRNDMCDAKAQSA
jgi:hypothetical protein